MTYWKVFAVVDGNIVKNVITGEPVDCMNIAHSMYGSNAQIVKVYDPDIPVQAGDTYNDGVFYRGEEVVEALPTERQRVAELVSGLRDSNNAIDDILVMLLEGGEENV